MKWIKCDGCGERYPAGGYCDLCADAEEERTAHYSEQERFDQRIAEQETQERADR